MPIRPILAVLPLLLVLAAPAYARGTLDSILPQIRAQHPGRLSDAEPWTDADGNAHYRIKWMTPEGRILYFDANARTGRYYSAGGDVGSQWRDHRSGEGTSDGGGRWNGEQGNRHDRGDQNTGSGRDHWNGDDRGDWRGRGDHGGHSGNLGDWHGGGGNGDNHHHGH